MEIETVLKIHVEPGDVLYVQLPDDMNMAQTHNALLYLRENMKGKGVTILTGKSKIDFTVITEPQMERLFKEWEARRAGLKG